MSASAATADGARGRLGTVESDIPARLDRLPWSKWHWSILIGLGTVWILDGLEVTVVGSIAARLAEKGSGAHMTEYQVAVGATFYVIGACLGALFFGWLTDRMGRKKLFMITLAVYLAATVATAFTMNPIWFWACRFFTGAGIGGEYAAINSAIDELIPARVRGRVDLAINGSFWVGAALGGALSVFLLSDTFAVDVGWRLAFGLGAILGICILIVRRLVPESPRWLTIHGRHEEAEQIVGDIERRVMESTGAQLEDVGHKSIKVNQRRSFAFGEIVRTVFGSYPRRTAVGLALFVGQAFIYNAVLFTLATTLTKYFGVEEAAAPWYIVVFAVGNFLGPLLLGPLFDTLGRKPMIAGTYLLSGVFLLVTAYLVKQGSLSDTGIMVCLSVVFFFASAGASSAYLTVSEVFPMETRALAISFFYAVGTGLGGAIGPLLFGKLIEQSLSALTWGYVLGAVLMIGGGLIHLFMGVEVARKNLEEIAQPLSAEDDARTTGERRDDANRTGRFSREDDAAYGVAPTPGPSGLRGRTRRPRA